MILNSLTILLIVAFSSCMQITDVKKNLLSDDRDLIIETAIWIKEGNVKDTSIVIELLSHILDSRISTSYTYYRETPYLNRIAALEKITGVKPPYNIERKLNALIVDYYLDWAINKGLIKTKDDIDVVPPFVREINDSKTFKTHIINQERVTWLDKYSWERPPFNDDKFHN